MGANLEVKVEVKTYTFFFSEGFCSPVVQKDKIWSLHRTLVRPAPTPQTGAKQQSEIRRITIGQK